MIQNFKISDLARCTLCAAASVFIALTAISCEKSSEQADERQPEPAIVSLSIVPETRAFGNTHGIQSDDNLVQTLEFFIFRAEGTDAGVLDTYKKLEGAELSSLSNIEIQSTTGAKLIYAVANSHNTDWTGVKTFTDFEARVSELHNEDLKNFTMTGSIEVVLQVSTSVAFSISRLVARIGLTGIKTDFAGTPYEGSELKNVKIYVTNVYANKRYSSGANATTPIFYNYKKAVAQDINLCTMSGMLYDEVANNISDAGYTVPHYFYCYENMLENETPDKHFTRLVIQGDLNGHTYYYPININREGFGYSAANGHLGVKRNTSYSLDVTICRPGSTDPDDILEYGVLTASLNVLDWVTVPVVYVNF